MRPLALVVVLALAGCSQVEEKSDWEREHEARLQPSEQSVALPAYPKEPQLIEFLVAATSEFRFYVDSASLSADKDIVRYVLVARSAGGADNVSFEGMRCETAQVRIYALGRNGAWTQTRSGWRAIVQRWHNTLFREYFCPQRESIRSASEGVDALRRGGNPWYKGLSGDEPRGGGATR